MKQKLLSLFFVLACFIGLSQAQNRQVSGQVTSTTDGSPISGVSVSVVGSTTATQTDGSGNYSISVSNGSVLNFSYIGFLNQRITVGNQTVINVQLVDESETLEEVVVTALGISKERRSVGYSVSNVSGEDLTKSGEANIIQGLAAKATGVQITSSSGTPGASSKIVLRGPATFSGDNQPLIVVDGVPIDNGVNFPRAGDDPYNQYLAGVQLGNRALDINPEDIESVTILKGPAAAALYGQAAGNGAIIYTTKRGKLGSGLGITFSTGAEIQQVNRLPKLQSKYGQGVGGVYSPAEPNSWGPNLETSNTPTYDNLGDFFQNGMNYNNNLAITSGGERTSFRFSIGSTNNEGVVPFTKFNRYTARLSSDTKLSDWMNVGGTLSYTNSNTRAAQNGSNPAGVMLALLRNPAEFNIADYENKEDGSQNTYFANYDNPLWSLKYNPYTEENNRITGNVHTDIKLDENFSINWKTGLDSYSTSGKQIYAVGSNGDDFGAGWGEVKYRNINYRNLYTDLLLNYKKEISSNFTVNALLGGNFNYKQYSSTFARGRNLAMAGYYNLASASSLYASNSEEYQNSKAIFLDATFDYRNILFLTLTGRNEWSTTFGKNAKGFFYPKADISYVFSHLLENQDIINYGKVRLAYSNVGIAPSVYSDRTYYETPFIADGMTNGFSFPYIGQTGYARGAVAVSDNFSPERNEGYEAGLEMKFFKGRLGLDFTYYQQISSDLLIVQPIDPTTGYSDYYNNIGKMKNEGIELGLEGTIVKSSDFSWNARVNWSTNDNEVLELAEGVTELSIGSAFSAPQSYAIVGEPFGVMYSQKFKRDGNGNIIVSPDGFPEYEDALGNVGSTIPDWLMNINNEFNYKNLSFSFLWDIRKGGKIWNGTYATLVQRGRADITADRDRTYVVDGVYADGTKNTTAISGVDYFSSKYLGNANTEIAIEDGSWVRLRSIDLSYRFKKISKAIDYLQLGVNLRNPLLFTKYKGVDPETSLTGSSQNFAGYDYYNNPGTRSYSLNLRIGF